MNMMNQDSREKSDLTGTQITKQLLKTRSGEFDLDSITSLVLQGIAIDNLGCIGDCTFLERLDLSKNNLTNLRPLTPLKQLSYLNISANRVSNIDPLRDLTSLQTLNASGNLISSIDNIRCLSSLDSFSSLTLFDPLTNLGNPVCHNALYKSNVLKILPGLKVIDGERVSGVGSELFELCKNMDAMLEGSKEDTPATTDLPGPWVSPDFWELKGAVDCDQTRWEVEQQFKDLLKSCKELDLAASVSLNSDLDKAS